LDQDVHLFLDERHMPPKAVGYESKGFTEQSIIQDFPLRGKPVYLHIRRQKWLVGNNDTGEQRARILYTICQNCHGASGHYSVSVVSGHRGGLSGIDEADRNIQCKVR